MDSVFRDRRDVLTLLSTSSLLFAGGIALSPRAAASAPRAPRAATPITASQLHSGHSLTDAAMARGKGYPNRHYGQLLNSVGRGAADVHYFTVPGSSLKHRTDKAAAAWNDIPNHQVVGVTERNDTYPLAVFGTGTGWINELRQQRRQSMYEWFERCATLGNGGRGSDFFFYTPWLAHADFNQPSARKRVTINRWRERLAYDEVEHLDVAGHAEAKVPGNAKVWIIPANAMMMRLWDDAEAGAIPGIANGTAFLASGRWWKDGVHPDHLGSLALAYLHMYVIHHVDPRGTAYRGFDMAVEPNAAEAAYIQNMIYDLVQNYPRAGVV